MNLKKLERYLRVNLLGPGPLLIKKRIYRAAVSQRLRNTAVEHCSQGIPTHGASSKNSSDASGERRGESWCWLALHLLSIIRTPCQLPIAQKFVITFYTMCLLLPNEDRLQTDARFEVTSRTKRLNSDCLQVHLSPTTVIQQGSEISIIETTP